MHDDSVAALFCVSVKNNKWWVPVSFLPPLKSGFFGIHFGARPTCGRLSKQLCTSYRLSPFIFFMKIIDICRFEVYLK